MDDLGVNEIHNMARNLFLAADKYAMERLKVVCTGILCRSIDDATVDSALALAIADQYDCGEFRDICIKHIDSSSRKGDHAVAGQQAYRRITRAKPSIWVVLWEKMRSLFRFK
jgi:speckle-type POZ protein